MLIEFSVKNYRSFRDETILSMEATKSSTLKSVLIPFGGMQILPSAAIYGKNGGGKSNVIRAFWLAVQFIRFQPQRKKCIPNHCIMRQKDEKRWFLPEKDKNFLSQKRKPAEN